jgi:hypothetical protein
MLLSCVACTPSARADAQKQKPKYGGCETFRKSRSTDRGDFTKWDYVSAWLGGQKKLWEIQPDKNEVHGPWKSKKECWECYKAETGKSFGLDQTWPEVSEAYFAKVWDSDHPNLKCHEYIDFMVSLVRLLLLYGRHCEPFVTWH